MNVTEWKLLCPGLSAETLTEGKPITNDASFPVSKALYEALRHVRVSVSGKAATP